MNWKSLLSSLSSTILSVAQPLLGSIIAGKATKYQDIAQTAVKSAVTKIDGGIDQLAESYNTFREDNPVFVEAQDEFLALAKNAGIVIPDLAVVQTHLKEAIFDLASGLFPNAGLTPPVASTPAV
ncbi:hypothetical protein C0V97_01025 [Asaia sp. W19]|uniref:hypothetical protein n=1 Tax=unclassified Asaia TaxID=2685023 RepID=UPI000F8CB637|nr:hypothetical protein [Asaia sp. W19]RUT27382.1 hypothetical protein C0V97_01025 [Asaia sp. W19]